MKSIFLTIILWDRRYICPISGEMNEAEGKKCLAAKERVGTWAVGHTLLYSCLGHQGSCPLVPMQDFACSRAQGERRIENPGEVTHGKMPISAVWLLSSQEYFCCLWDKFFITVHHEETMLLCSPKNGEGNNDTFYFLSVYCVLDIC